MYDVIALGELLIDFTPNGLSTNKGFLFEQNPGGAPANVLVVLSKLNMSTGFIGKVGEDQFGYFLRDTLSDINVGTKGLIFTDEVNTTLAFVHLDNQGERRFSFYRNPGADMMLTKEEINFEMIRDSKIFHFGSISMTHEPSRSATLEAVKYAKEKNILISYDPNFRPLLWRNIEEAKKIMRRGLEYANILKVSEEELALLTGINDIEKGAEYLENKYNTSLIIVTLGSNGSYFRKDSKKGFVPTYNIKAVDTTGAGDGFLGGVLYQILTSKKSINQLDHSDLTSMLCFANAVGALMTMKTGAIPAIPTLEKIKDFMGNKNIRE